MKIESPDFVLSDRKSNSKEELPFTLSDLRRAIPRQCFEPSLWRSLSYLARDLLLIATLASVAITLNSWIFWPLYWFFQGTMFWALFVIGHDCGHGSFSKNGKINHFFGYLAHSPILVPYHSWRISHRKHHLNTGHAENEETWYPLKKSEYEQLPLRTKIFRFYLFFLGFIPYLFFRGPGRSVGSHFLPSSQMFQPHERTLVLKSSLFCALALGTLICLAISYGWGLMANLYLGPYLIFIIYLDVVTFLHHTEETVPWYRDGVWDFLKGNLSTIDQDYGLINPIHHNIGTHMVHHLFINIPHYYLKEATDAIIPILGPYYRKSKISIFKGLWLSYKRCRFVPDNGDVVYYQSENTK